MSEKMLHSNYGQTLTRVISRNFGVYTFILPLSLLPRYLSTVWMFYQRKGYLKENKNTSEFLQTNSGRFQQAHWSGSNRIHSA